MKRRAGAATDDKKSSHLERGTMKSTSTPTKCDSITAAGGSHCPSNNTNTTPQSSDNASAMSTGHSLSVGAAVASQTLLQSSGAPSSSSTPPPAPSSHSNDTQQLHFTHMYGYERSYSGRDYYICFVDALTQGHRTDNCGQQYRT